MSRDLGSFAGGTSSSSFASAVVVPPSSTAVIVPPSSTAVVVPPSSTAAKAPGEGAFPTPFSSSTPFAPRFAPGLGRALHPKPASRVSPFLANPRTRPFRLARLSSFSARFSSFSSRRLARSARLFSCSSFSRSRTVSALSVAPPTPASDDAITAARYMRAPSPLRPLGTAASTADAHRL